MASLTPRLWTIYRVTNLVTGKLYIGQTSGKLAYRWLDHCNTSKHKHKSALRSSIAKHGKENFTIEVIEELTSQEEANDREIFWIKSLNTLTPVGYNIQMGGNVVGCMHEDTKRKISIAQDYKKRKIVNITTGDIYESTCEAADKLNASKSNITKVCQGVGSYQSIKGNILKYAEDDSFVTPERITSKQQLVNRCIAAYTPGGQLVGKWNTLLECAKALGLPDSHATGLSRYASGKRASLCHGYKLTYETGAQ